MMRQIQPMGIIYTCNPSACFQHEILTLSETIPLVVIKNRDLDMEVDVVELNNAKPGRLMARHLLDLGHRKVGFISPPLTRRQQQRFQRVEGFMEEFREAGLPEGVIGCCAMGLAGTWLAFLVIFIIAKIGYSGSLVFYDSMLGDVTTPERMDMVSSRGYAWGYIGSCVPFVVCLALVLGSSVVGLSQMTALSIALVITAVWWLAVTLPLLKKYRQINYVEVEQHAIRQSFVRIGQTLKHLPQDKQVFWFLLAFFCYIDGVYTIIDMATAYGTALGLDTTGLLLALLVTQIVAFPSALIFGRLSQKYASKTLIPVCIAAYTGIAVFAFFLKSQWQFWVLAVVVGMFQGGVQALSRSHFAKIIPQEKSGEYFGLFDICGKGASFLGTMIVSVGSQLTGSANVGVGSIAILFVIGFVLFSISTRTEETKQV